MSRLIKTMALLFVFALVLGGCSKTDVPEPQLTTKKLYELYPGDLKKVDYIEIRSGSTGQEAGAGLDV